MSLRIWLPLDGDLRNLGDFNLQAPIKNTGTWDDNGKIGKCYNFAEGQLLSYQNVDLNIYNEWSVAAWIYPTGDTIDNHDYIVSMQSGSGTNTFLFSICWRNNKLGIRLQGTTYTVDDESDLKNKWTHICGTYEAGTLKIYLNGQLRLVESSVATPIESNKLILGCRLPEAGLYVGRLNDVRIYDHVLSNAEVHEISLGLITHYQLDENLTILDNQYQYSTFNTADESGGWRHWARSGAIGTYGQNTNKKYIYNKKNTYSHWVANDSTATAEYWLYQAPSFSGGVRSLQCIVKEENSRPIDENILFPSWNSRSGGIPLYFWTTITHLGNGFYLCKAEGISQDGSSDNIGIYIRPGYKVYFSEVYLENREYSADLFQQDNLSVITDSSGYNRHAIINSGNLTMSNDTPRYNSCTNWDGSTYGTLPDIFNTDVLNTELTWAGWIKKGEGVIDTTKSIYRGIVHIYIHSSLGVRIYWRHASTTTSAANAWAPGLSIQDNEWNHIAFTFKDGLLCAYLNGQKIGTTDRSRTGQFILGNQGDTIGREANDNDTSFIGCLSDMRIYSTALSDKDIQKLYNTSLRLSRYENRGGRTIINKTIHTFNILENNKNKLTRTGLLQSGGIIENILPVFKYDNNIYIEPDGSCWVRIYHHNNPSAGVFNSTDNFTKSVYIDENRWFNVSLCNYTPWCEFMMKFCYTADETEKKCRWQQVNPMTATYNDVTQVHSIITDEYEESAYNGLYHGTSGNPGANTHLSANDGHSNHWYGAVGCYTLYNGGIPGWAIKGDSYKITTTGYNDLYLRIDDDASTPLPTDEFNGIKNTKNNLWFADNFIEI